MSIPAPYETPDRKSPRASRVRSAAIGLSLAAHAALLLVILSAHTAGSDTVEPEPMAVSLIPPPPLALEPSPVPAATPAPAAAAPPKKSMARPVKNPPRAATLAASDEAEVEEGVELTDAQVAGAARAGSGGGGRACDMIARIQAALRKDSLVHAAASAAGTGGKAIMVWNGDWVRSGSQAGKGLAAVREAIIWEIAFAPEACRAEPVRGLVMISLNDAAESARLVVGSDQWRWSDLTMARSTMRSR